MPCADTSIAPVFQYKHAPENPFENFAAGKIGILKPTYRRVVLYAAYRFLNNGAFSADEQNALVEVWDAEFKNEEPKVTEPAEIIKRWIEKRNEVAKDEENLPSIYVERQWGGYTFFPNCGTNAFETAIETLSDRISSYGAENKNVAEWLRGQDAVFSNCAGGKNIPASGAEFPRWLQKDRAYQIGAAEFYSLDFEEAKKTFEAIALDAESVWQETAEYLVGRILLRQASFTKDEPARKKFYAEAEDRLKTVRGGKFYDSAEKLINLIKLRTRPEERTRELAQRLLPQQFGEQLGQDLIDYTWLLDDFENEILKAEEKRKDDAEIAKFANADRQMREAILAGFVRLGVSVEVKVLKGEVTLNGKIPSEKYEQALLIANNANPRKVNDNLTRVTKNADGGTMYQGGDSFEESMGFSSKEAQAEREAIWRGDLMEIEMYGGDFRRIVVATDATDEEIFEVFQAGGSGLSEEREKELIKELEAKGIEINFKRKLTDADKEKIREATREARAKQMRYKLGADYQGGYSGGEKLTLSLLPAFLRADELTDWLFTFQIQNENSYLHALEKWRQTKSDLWLTSALVKANKNSKEINEMLESAGKIKRTAPAFPTVAYHTARIFIEQNKQAEARKLLDDVLNSSLDLPISSRNEFAEMRMKIAETLTTFLKNSTRKPFTFADYGRSITIDEEIARQKEWWSTDYSQPKFEWDKNIEESLAEYKIWEHRLMFDEKTVAIMNEHFSLQVLLEAQRSPELPEYLRERLAIVIWTRAALLENDSVLQRIAPELVKTAPEVEEYLKASTPQSRRFAALFVIYRHENFAPFIRSGFDRGYTIFSIGWWCALSNVDYDEKGNEFGRMIPPKPSFLTKEQSGAAQSDLKRLSVIGSAPGFLAEKAIEWLKLAPKDKRLPEVLYRAHEANESYQYGCASGAEQEKLAALLRTNFPDSEWTRKLKNRE
jgi:hypothetical protein